LIHLNVLLLISSLTLDSEFFVVLKEISPSSNYKLLTVFKHPLGLFLT